MAFSFLRSPYFLGGAGALALFGATVYQYGRNQSMKTGFHHKDPDPTLRVVEKDVLIAKYMTESARKVKCKTELDAFNECVKATPMYSFARWMTFRTCKPQADTLMECMNSYFIDKDFYEENKAAYLRDKALFQATNVMKKKRQLLKEILINGEPEIEMNDDAKTYFNGLKEHYTSTGNIDSYDDFLSEKYKADNPNPPKVKQYTKFGM